MAPNTENFNEDELEAPAWLDAEFFAKVLQAYEEDDSISVQNLKLSPASVKGDHYASIMFRASVDYGAAADRPARLRSKLMIIKTMPDLDGIKKELLQESSLFETEIAMYSEVIPKFEGLLKQIGDETQLGVRCLYCSLSPHKVIIFEDIVPLGYEVLRERHVNLEEAKLTYTKLAKWHAVSYKLHQEDPAYFDKFRYNVMDLADTSLADFFEDGIVHFIALLDSQPSLLKYKPYFEALKPGLIDRCRASYNEYRLQPQQDAHYVLCHGDFHCKNMMFKHAAEGQLQDVMLLDFQMCHIGPMANDLIYSVYLLLDKTQRWQQLDELLHHYFCCFTETLRRLDYKGRMPRLLELRQDLLRHNDLDILLLVTFLPMWYVFRTGEADPDKIVSSSEYRKQLYNNAEFLAELEECLPRFLHRGYLDS